MKKENDNPAPKTEQEEREKIKGVFSSQEMTKVGTGTTSRKTIKKAFWFAEEDENDTILLQPLNANYVPSGPKRVVPMDDFLNLFSPEMEFYVQTVFPRMRELNKTIARADRHRKNGEHFSAEYEFGNALGVDEENVRASFGLGLTYLERGQTDKADDLFQRIVNLDASFEQEHKHLFNDFGISLRKNKMHTQSIDYYKKALDLSKADENLYCNMARAYLDADKHVEAIDNLLEALKLNPSHEVSIKFLTWMLSKKLVPTSHKELVQAAMGKDSPSSQDSKKKPEPIQV